MAPHRLTWKAVDHGLGRLNTFLIVAALVCAILAAVRVMMGSYPDAIMAGVIALAGVVMSLVLSPLMLARMTIDEQGITRAGRGGFSVPWAKVTQAGIGEGLMASGWPYLILDVEGKRRHTTVLAVAGSGFGRPSLAAPLDKALAAEVGAVLAERGLLRTEADWGKA